jgi:dTDP-4-amino-4,6-dideoxygalactose transaminase
LQKAYQHKGHQEGDFPICEKIAREIVSLPMFPQLKADQQQRVVKAVAGFVETKVAPLAR